MVNSATPAWKNAPLKSPRTNSFVFFKNPSVLSELLKSADAQIILGTCSAKIPKHAALATRVAAPSCNVSSLQSTFGARPLNHSSICCAKLGLASRHARSVARRSATN